VTNICPKTPRNSSPRRESCVTVADAPWLAPWPARTWALDDLPAQREFRCTDCGAQVRAFRPPVGDRCAVCQWIADAPVEHRADLRAATEGAR
jgi:hypothetical protein